MFSLLDAIMDQPLPVLLGKLPLSAEVKAALLEGEGDLGELLDAIEAFQGGNWENVSHRFDRDNVMMLSYEQALKWCNQVKDDLGL